MNYFLDSLYKFGNARLFPIDAFQPPKQESKVAPLNWAEPLMDCDCDDMTEMDEANKARIIDVFQSGTGLEKQLAFQHLTEFGSNYGPGLKNETLIKKYQDIIADINSQRLFCHLNLSNIQLLFADLRNLDLTGAIFDGATLISVVLFHTILKEASFNNASLKAVYIDSAQIQDAQFNQTNISLNLPSPVKLKHAPLLCGFLRAIDGMNEKFNPLKLSLMQQIVAASLPIIKDSEDLFATLFDILTSNPLYYLDCQITSLFSDAASRLPVPNLLKPLFTTDTDPEGPDSVAEVCAIIELCFAGTKRRGDMFEHLLQGRVSENNRIVRKKYCGLVNKLNSQGVFCGLVRRNREYVGRNLSNLNLTGADLYGTSLVGADLSGAILNDAKMVKVRIAKTKITPETQFQRTSISLDFPNVDRPAFEEIFIDMLDSINCINGQYSELKLTLMLQIVNQVKEHLLPTRLHHKLTSICENDPLFFKDGTIATWLNPQQH